MDLLFEFLEAFPVEYRITFIGDHNELPPIGLSFGEQMMNWGKVKTYRLTDKSSLWNDTRWSGWSFHHGEQDPSRELII